MRRLILIRHSQSASSPGTPPEKWPLSAEGRRRAEALAMFTASLGAKSLYSSDEPKAVETAEAVSRLTGLEVRIEPGFKEHIRTDAPYFDTVEEFRAAVIEAVRRPNDLVFGSETTGAAQRRFCEAVAKVDAEAPPGDIAIVSHGTVMSMFIAELTGADAVEIWRGLGLPAAFIVSWPDADGIELQRNFD